MNPQIVGTIRRMYSSLAVGQSAIALQIPELPSCFLMHESVRDGNWHQVETFITSYDC